ncbi:MAG: glycine cleavage system aminomethyltransferase GcvT [Alphaproteobacteria bacterium]|nr:glycine cleavage system aminomethyltransferase GcvT [Alphaproteobacteria bacterium]
MSEPLLTPLYDLHIKLGARMVPFAGYSLPVQYPSGVMKEHSHTREKAGLFDVSHMGQVIVSGADYDTVATALERLIPVDVLGLGPDRQRYGFLTDDKGGILDDLMFSNRGDHVFIVVNGACKASDISYMQNALPDVTVSEIKDRALLALQGPRAEITLSTLNPAVKSMRFMDVKSLNLVGTSCWVSRSGYTGEDGFEISVSADHATVLANALLENDDVEPIGLGARDSLRLESGLCLYGHDIDDTTTPVEGALNWAIPKVRRLGGYRSGGFPGANTILRQLDSGTKRKRVGLLPSGRAPMREGVKLYASQEDKPSIGVITSGGFGPTVGSPVAMGYLATDYATVGTQVFGELRGSRLPLNVVKMPFIPANFKR